MSRTLANGTAEVQLGNGTWTAQWPAAGITLGPCDAGVADRGTWKVTTTRSGARARWTARDGWVELHLAADGPMLTVQVGRRADVATTLDRITVLDGVLTPAPAHRLVEGYDSWSYAGIRAATAPGRSTWRTTLVGPDRTLGVQALTANRFTTTIATDASRVRVEAGSTPPLRALDGTWGFETLAPEALRLPVAAGEEIVSELVAITAGVDPLAVTELVAALVARRDWHGPAALGWESWYYYAIAIDPANLLGNARLLRERFGGRPGFDLFQIDDGWQQTYGAWWPNERFPADLGELVAELHGLGLRVGLWLAPFMVVPDAIGLGTEHEDWCLRDRETGVTIRDRHDRWALDASNPAVLAYLRDLGAQVRAWGVDMVKLDFLYLGAQEAARHDPRVTGTEALRAGLRAFVDPLGDDVYVLGCGAPMLPVVGICHANRIGHDLAVPVIAREFGQPLTAGWTGWHGIKAQARQAAARWALHGRWFQNDPEIVMAWGSDGRGGADGYSLEESHTQAVVAALTGGPFLLADELAALLPEERAVLEDSAVLDLAWDERGFRPVDLFDHVDDAPVEHAYASVRDLASIWVAARAGKHVVALFNWTDEPAIRTAPDGTTLELPPHAARVLPA